MPTVHPGSFLGPTTKWERGALEISVKPHLLDPNPNPNPNPNQPSVGVGLVDSLGEGVRNPTSPMDPTSPKSPTNPMDQTNTNDQKNTKDQEKTKDKQLYNAV